MPDLKIRVIFDTGQDEGLKNISIEPKALRSIASFIICFIFTIETLGLSSSSGSIISGNLASTSFSVPADGFYEIKET